MGKFTSAQTAATSPVTTTGTTTTFEGGAAFTRDAKSDLFLFAAVNMVGENTFYESAGARDQRFRDLVRAATLQDPDWVASFVPYLRGEMNMRSAAIVMAAESALARKDGTAQEATIPVRKMVADAMLRADEPAEFIAYWKQRTGKKTLPGGVQRGVADAVARLYTERSALKYDGSASPWRMADVVALAKPEPAGSWQADLFDYLADRRWKREVVRVTDRLPILSAYRAAATMPEAERRAWFLEDPERLKAAGMTWEQLSSLGAMDAAAWSAMIPHMGLMALTRNLRNFDEAKVSDGVAATVCARLADPVEVGRSRQFPFRFLSAYRAAPSLRWGHALEQALAAATANIPELPGRTLVLVDTSASMRNTVSAKSQVRHVDVGALFAVALATRGCSVDLVGYADGVFQHPLTRAGSVLKQAEAFCQRIGEVGHGTETVAALQASFKGHDRVVIVSDMQAFAHPGYGWARSSTWGRPARASMSVSEAIPANVPMFGINTTGYAQATIDSSQVNRYEIGGFSDKLFTMIDLLSRGRDAKWPWV
ncbi:TROVE domain-containing protein [Streptomyces sp. H10-C2]|uniref:TROVE domain-containing protein n=1 Tax=unclassified Streptomyces TaxID=2593676 RepID=UPI0024B8BB00|nr:MULTISPECIES: TROVE domain-containing protein [unclassified Streptomyces]MDJ0345232.1 TROVE domain-containing protein [Streptomyces sp. PH10-H1]MDJ0368822.1 TROVE domain-containing protein [Streptomyces sp. H10-C2]